MDFAAIMKDEIGRKRKKVESELKIDGKKKYFKRSDLARVEKEKYEERMGMKLAPPPEDRISALEQKTQAMLDRLGPDQVTFFEKKNNIFIICSFKAKMMPREVVMKKLRERQEPIRLFGESDYDAFFRLRKLELGCQEQYKIQGWTNEIKEAMEQMDDEDIAEVTKSMSRGDAKAEKKYNIIYKYEHPEVDHDWLLANRHLLKVRAIS